MKPESRVCGGTLSASTATAICASATRILSRISKKQSTGSRESHPAGRRKMGCTPIFPAGLGLVYDSRTGGNMSVTSLVLALLLHHSFAAEFDSAKPVELKGTVT